MSARVLQVGAARSRRGAALVLALVLGALLAGCGGGSSSSLAANQMRVTVERDPNLIKAGREVFAPDMPYVSVVVCDGSDHCVTVPYVQLDTGSVGLHLRAKTLAGLDLQPVLSASGKQVDACSNFAQGYIWGAVEQANVQLGGEPAMQLPIQVFGSGSPAPDVPALCTTLGNNIGSLLAVGGNGILGVAGLLTGGTTDFTCDGSSCNIATSLDPTLLIENPVTFLANGDDNGVILTLPAIPASGAASAQGALTFGLDSRSDNQTAGFHAFGTDAYGNLSMSAQGQTYTQTAIDSGSSFLYLPFNMPYDSSTQYYTPSTLQIVPITLSNEPGTSPDVSVSSSLEVGNIISLVDTGNDAFDDIGQYAPSSSTATLSLPYFFGRSVAYGMPGTTSGLGPGPVVGVLNP